MNVSGPDSPLVALILLSKDEPRHERDLSGIFSAASDIRKAGRQQVALGIAKNEIRQAIWPPAMIGKTQGMTIKPNVFKSLAGAEGFELSTYGFGDRRSNQLS